MTVLVVGDANADLSAATERFPAEGDDTQLRSLGWGSGGAAVNVATGLALLGTPARLVARIGRDPAAEVALRAARAAGADLACLQRDSATATGLCFAAISPGGERTFFSFRGANADLQPPPRSALDNVRWLHLCGHALLEGAQQATALALLEWSAEQGTPASLDLCLPLVRRQRPLMLQLLSKVAILFANEAELAAAALPANGPAMVALKRGAGGCSVTRGAEQIDAPAFDVAVVDCNGCGDGFVAGFLHAYQRGASLPECATLANAVGALVATRPGSADAMPDLPRLQAFLSDRGIPTRAI